MKIGWPARMALLLVSQAASAASYFIAPSGLDSNDGTSPVNAWKTFARALPVLRPGDELVLADGRYQHAINGELKIDCSVGAQNGLGNMPIVVRAQNERQAWLDASAGYAGLSVTACSNWEFRGLRLSGADVPDPTGSWYVVELLDSNDIILSRLLVTHANRYVNAQLLEVLGSNRILIEESELYWFARAGISFSASSSGIVRRSYVNSRNYPDIDGGFGCCDPLRGDVGVFVWRNGNDVLIENVVSEGQHDGVGVTSVTGISRVTVAGSISLHDVVGARVDNNAYDGGAPAADISFTNFLAVAPQLAGMQFLGTQGGRCTHCSIVGDGVGPIKGILSEPSVNANYGTARTELENVLVTNAVGVGFEVSGQSSWFGRGLNAYGADIAFTPWPSNYSETTELNPQLGECLVSIPPTSPMKRRASDGTDVGANILWRSQDGVETQQPLWDQTTGAFPCGALVAGVNDVPGASCFDLHERLRVKSPDCSPHPPGADAGGDGPNGRQLAVGCGCSQTSTALLLMASVWLPWKRRGSVRSSN